MSKTSISPNSYHVLKTTLLPPNRPAPVLPPPRSTINPALTAAISYLSLHPTLEALLHILNADLPAAHFLVRHMQARPRWEGMLLHAVLHRVEGDVENARAWYGDVSEGCAVGDGDQADDGGDHNADGEGTVWDAVWGGKHGGMDRVNALLDRIRALRENRGKFERTAAGKDGDTSEREAWQKEKAECEHESEREVRAIFSWCEAKFGTEAWQDASEAWVGMGEKHKEIASKMLVGGEGWRNF